MKRNKQDIVAEYEALDKEIDEQNAQRKLQNKKLAKKEKRAKARKRFISGMLGLIATAGVAGLAYSTVKGSVGYNGEVNASYAKVMKNLNRRLEDCPDWEEFDNPVIQDFYFEDNDEENVKFIVRVDGLASERSRVYRQGKFIFDVLREYYENLLEAEENDNALMYMDSLFDIIKNMKHTDSTFEYYIEFSDPIKKEEDAQKILDLFELDIQQEGVKRQIGFLPYYIECVSWETNTETGRKEYEYKISGVSYCETEDRNSDKIKDHRENQTLVMESQYDKHHIKAFYREISYKSSVSIDKEIMKNTRLSGDLISYLLGRKTKEDFEIKTTYFDETTIFDDYLKMKDGKRWHKMPEDFDLIKYRKERKEIEKNYEPDDGGPHRLPNPNR